MSTILEKISIYAADKEHCDRLMMADSKKSLTYKEGWELIRKIAGHLKNMPELPEKSAIMAYCTQDCAYVASVFAIQLAGFIAVPIEKGASEARIAEIAADSKASLIIGNKKANTGILPFMDLKTVYDIDPSEILTDPVFPELDDVAEYLFSTGTTGKSKGIVITHRNNVAIAENIGLNTEMKSGNIELIPMPLSHSHGIRTVYSNTYYGNGCVFSNGVLMAKAFYNLLDTYKCTAIDMAPSILSALFQLTDDTLGEYKDQLDYIELGSAPLVEEDKKRLCKLLPDTRLYNFYGSTESGRTCALNFNDGVERPQCIGHPSKNAEFIFVDKEHNKIEATRENPGFIATGGPQNMKEYLNAPDLTAQASDGKYIYTNDLGFCDEAGFVYCLGREDDVINCAGIKISPDEIESVARKFDGVADCAVVPAPDNIQGQVPKLFIAVNGTQDSFDLDGYRQFLKKELDGNKVPKSIEFIDEIPRTSNGKLQRKKLVNR